MQQTDKYKLNLIETSDTFSPAPLNENMEKVEVQFDAVRAEAAAGDAALAQRVTTLEVHTVVVGYAASGDTTMLGATPRAVIAFGTGSGGGSGLAVTGHAVNGVQIIEGGFRHTGYQSECNYIAVL